MEALKAEIYAWLEDEGVCQPDSDGMVEFSIKTLSSGANGVHQPSDIFTALNMEVPEGENPETYSPDDDEFIWEDIEKVAMEEGSEILDALMADPDFDRDMTKLSPNWGVRFGHRDSDGDYCLFFWYSTIPLCVEGDEE